MGEPLPLGYALGGKDRMLQANRELLAMILDQLTHPIVLVPPMASTERERRENVWYALALGAMLGYPVGLDGFGYAHIDLPSGEVTFFLGHWEGLGGPEGKPAVRARAEEYYRLVTSSGGRL